MAEHGHMHPPSQVDSSPPKADVKDPPPAVKDPEVQRVLQSDNCFDLLELKLGEKDEQVIKSAYKQISLKVHPDKCRDESAKSAFQAVQAAKDVLVDTTKREAHLTDIAKKAAQKTPPSSAPTPTPASTPRRDWMYDTFEFLREAEMREKEERKQREWRRIHEEREKEEARRKAQHAVFERGAKQYHDPLFAVQRRLNEREDRQRTANTASSLAFLPAAAEGMLLRSKYQKLSDEASRADGARKKDKKDKKEKKEKRRKRSSSSEEGTRKRARKEKKAGKKDKWEELRRERLLREAGESVRQAKIRK